MQGRTTKKKFPKEEDGEKKEKRSTICAGLIAFLQTDQILKSITQAKLLSGLFISQIYATAINCCWQPPTANVKGTEKKESKHCRRLAVTARRQQSAASSEM